MKSSGPPQFRSLPPFGTDESEATSITSFARVQDEISKGRRVTAYLIGLQGSNVGAMFKLDGPELVIGRASAAHIRLQDEGVSRRHARIIQVADQLVIEDLQSANGTVVNGEKVDHRVLQDGDKIRFGGTTILKFTYHDNLDESFQKQMYEAAIRDGLTKAFNKKYLLDRLATEFAYAQRHKTALSLVMFDIDHFKKVNDTLGHLAGDAALFGVARLASQIIRTEDVLGRYGGEEFGVICRGVPVLSAAILAERLRAALAQTPLDWQGQIVRLTISLGVAGIPELVANSPTDLIAAADEALYESKNGGRNRVSVRGVARR
jgi:two-component system, cell cycle response regulator